MSVEIYFVIMVKNSLCGNEFICIFWYLIYFEVANLSKFNQTKNKHSQPIQVYVLAFGICLDISNSYGAWQNAGAKVQFHKLQRKNRMHAFIYLHPECIVSRCYKVARAAQLMWRVLCVVQLPLRAALFPFPHFHPYILFWPLLRTPVFCFHFRHNNRTLCPRTLIGQMCSANSGKMWKKIDACTHLQSLAHVAWIADYRNLLLCVAETIAAISSPGREKSPWAIAAVIQFCGRSGENSLCARVMYADQFNAVFSSIIPGVWKVSMHSAMWMSEVAFIVRINNTVKFLFV